VALKKKSVVDVFFPLSTAYGNKKDCE